MDNHIDNDANVTALIDEDSSNTDSTVTYAEHIEGENPEDFKGEKPQDKKGEISKDIGEISDNIENIKGEKPEDIEDEKFENVKREKPEDNECEKSKGINVKKLEETAPNFIINDINLNLNNTLPDFRCFNPLPSTSSDNVIIDLNDSRFNEASGVPTLPEGSSVRNEMVPSYINLCESNPRNTDSVIECSSGSEIEDIINLDKRVKKFLKKRKNLSRTIDLILDEANKKNYDSDCEIVDVDQLIAENNDILNKFSSSAVIQLDTTDQNISSNTPPPSIVQSSNRPPLAIPITSEAPQTDKKNLNRFDKMLATIKDFFDKNKTSPGVIEPNHKCLPESISLSAIEAVPTTRMTLRRSAKKRPRVVETIDLSRNFTPNRQSTSEVIDIDSYTSTSVQTADSTSERALDSSVPPPLVIFYHNRLPKKKSPNSDNSHNVFYKYVSHNSTSDNNIFPRKKSNNSSHNTFYKFVSHGSTSRDSPVNDDSLQNILVTNNVSLHKTTNNIARNCTVTNHTSHKNIDSRNTTRNIENSNITNQSMEPRVTTPVKQLGECPVCLETFSQGNAVSTFCGHIFCTTCILKIKVTSKKCPTCRKALRGKGYHPIFL